MDSTLLALAAAGVDSRLCRSRAGAAHADREGHVGAQAGMVLSAAGSIWTTDLALGRVVRIDPATNTVTQQDRRSLRGRSASRTAPAASGSPTARSTRSAGSTRAPARCMKKIRIGYSTYGATFARRQRLGDERARRHRPPHQPEEEQGHGDDQGRHDAERRRLRVRLALGRGPRRRQALEDQRQDEQGRRSGSRIAKVDWITPSPDALWVSSETGSVYRVDPSDRRGHREGRRSAPTRSARRGSTASSGSRTSTTARSRSSIPRRTRCARRSRRARARSRSRRPQATSGSPISDDGEVWRVRPVQ